MTISDSQCKPLARTKCPREERTGSRYSPRALILRPQRRSIVSSTPSTTSPTGRKASSTCTRSVRATARPSQRARFSTSWKHEKPGFAARPMTRSAWLTVRLPGASTAPATSTRIRDQTGAEKQGAKGGQPVRKHGWRQVQMLGGGGMGAMGQHPTSTQLPCVGSTTWLADVDPASKMRKVELNLPRPGQPSARQRTSWLAAAGAGATATGFLVLPCHNSSGNDLHPGLACCRIWGMLPYGRPANKSPWRWCCAQPGSAFSRRG